MSEYDKPRRMLFEEGDRLWLVTPSWDEGDEWEPAYGTASLVIADTEEQARQAMSGDNAGCPDWLDVVPLGSKDSLTRSVRSPEEEKR